MVRFAISVALSQDVAEFMFTLFHAAAVAEDLRFDLASRPTPSDLCERSWNH